MFEASSELASVMEFGFYCAQLVQYGISFIQIGAGMNQFRNQPSLHEIEHTGHTQIHTDRDKRVA